MQMHVTVQWLLAWLAEHQAPECSTGLQVGLIKSKEAYLRMNEIGVTGLQRAGLDLHLGLVLGLCEAVCTRRAGCTWPIVISLQPHGPLQQ